MNEFLLLRRTHARPASHTTRLLNTAWVTLEVEWFDGKRRRGALGEICDPPTDFHLQWGPRTFREWTVEQYWNKELKDHGAGGLTRPDLPSVEVLRGSRFKDVPLERVRGWRDLRTGGFSPWEYDNGVAPRILTLACDIGRAFELPQCGIDREACRRALRAEQMCAPQDRPPHARVGPP